MLREEDKSSPLPSPPAAAAGGGGSGSRKVYTRSVSWAGGSPVKSTQGSSKSVWSSKVRSCLPPLRPLSISRPNAEEWPGVSSDDLGDWPAATTATPGVRSGPPPLPFEGMREKLAFFERDCSRIVDHVFLGSDAVAKDREVLRRHEITHVLNCVGFVCPEYFKNDLVYKTLWLRDSPSEDITSILYDVFDYFEDVRERNGRVLVHCCQGVSRSTSLVIAYLMWREGQSFNNAFQQVKAARGVTNPNMGFASQLLQCQKRVHAAPASPNSVLRMYRMAPHSSYAPLHLVPKMVARPNVEALDSRGAFIVHIPSGIYMWIGRHCVPLMSESASSAASQVIRYEKASGPVLTVKEGEEPIEFWTALGDDKEHFMEDNLPGERKLDEYDLDFGIFSKAANGGVVPPLAMSGNNSEMCLPARQSGWERLRRKLAAGVMKELIMNSNSNVYDDVSALCDSPGSCSLFSARSSSVKSNSKDDKDGNSECSSPSSFLSFLVTDTRKFDNTSPSVSPSSDYSNSFTFSPTSSNWSDLSFTSAQPSPSGLNTSNANVASSSRMNSPSEGQTPKNLVKPSSFSMKDQNMEDAEEDLAQDDREESMLDAENEEYYDTSTEMANFVLYQWPTMEKLKMDRLIIPDSRSVYIIYGSKKPEILYIWVGRDVTCVNNDGCEEWQTIGRDFLGRKGLPTSSIVQIVREGEEPEQLWKHNHCFPFGKKE